MLEINFSKFMPILFSFNSSFLVPFLEMNPVLVDYFFGAVKHSDIDSVIEILNDGFSVDSW